MEVKIILSEYRAKEGTATFVRSKMSDRKYRENFTVSLRKDGARLLLFGTPHCIIKINYLKRKPSGR